MRQEWLRTLGCGGWITCGDVPGASCAASAGLDEPMLQLRPEGEWKQPPVVMVANITARTKHSPECINLLTGGRRQRQRTKSGHVGTAGWALTAYKDDEPDCPVDDRDVSEAGCGDASIFARLASSCRLRLAQTRAPPVCTEARQNAGAQAVHQSIEGQRNKILRKGYDSTVF
jgi:hypothetical protein